MPTLQFVSKSPLEVLPRQRRIIKITELIEQPATPVDWFISCVLGSKRPKLQGLTMPEWITCGPNHEVSRNFRFILARENIENKHATSHFLPAC